VWQILAQTVRQWLRDGAPTLAGALSFYTVVSLAPLVTMSLSLAALFYGDQALRGEIVAQVHRYVGAAGAEVIEDILASARLRGAGVSAWISVLLLLVGASAVFAQLQAALNTVWNVAPRPGLSLARKLAVRLLSIGLVLATGLLLLVLTVTGAALSRLAAAIGSVAALEAVWRAADSLAGVALSAALFAAMFKFLPDALIRWRDVWVGALITAALFNAGRAAIGIYLSHTAPGSAYGAAGSLVALLLWIYYSSLILFLGAEFTQVYARRYGRRIRPAAFAIRTSLVTLPVDDDGNPLLSADVRAEVRSRSARSSAPSPSLAP
jgi:membrane protein